MPDNWISVTEAAARLGITRQRVGQLIAAGELAGELISGTFWIVRAEAVESLAGGRAARGRR